MRQILLIILMIESVHAGAQDLDRQKMDSLFAYIASNEKKSANIDESQTTYDSKEGENAPELLWVPAPDEFLPDVAPTSPNECSVLYRCTEDTVEVTAQATSPDSKSDKYPYASQA